MLIVMVSSKPKFLNEVNVSKNLFCNNVLKLNVVKSFAGSNLNKKFFHAQQTVLTVYFEHKI